MTDSTLAPSTSFTTWLDAIEVMRKGSYKDYLKLGINDQAEPLSQRFTEWLDSDEWNGHPLPARGTPEHQIAKDALIFTSTIMTPPFSSAFISWAFENTDKVKALLSTEAVTTKDYDLLRADLLKEFGEALLDREPPNPITGELGKPRRISPMLNSDKNNTYLTKNSKGEWVTLTEDEVAKIARNPDGPRIMVTATHAFFESIKDMTPLPNMYEDVAKTATLGKVTEAGVAAEPRIKLKAIDENPGKGDTIVICGTNTRENNFLNLEDLFRRLHDIEAHHTHPWDDDFRHTSQMAIQMNALILKTIANEDDMGRVHKLSHKDGVLQTNSPNGKPLLFSATAEEPLRLTPNASETIRKIMFVGFSKAGNAFRDGSRLIQHQLKATDANGKPLVKGDVDAVIGNLSVTGGSFNEKEFTYYWHNDELISLETAKKLFDDKVITAEELENILENPYYRVRQAMISNIDDTIAPPRNFPATLKDVAYSYRGGRTHADNGHTFKRKFEGVIADPTLLDYYSTGLAPNTGRAAIAHINYNPENHSLILISGTTTDHALLDSRLKEFEEALQSKGIDVSIRSNGSAGNERFEITGNAGFELFRLGNLIKLGRELKACGPESDAGIFVSRAVTTIEMPRLLNAASHLLSVRKGMEEGPETDATIEKMMRNGAIPRYLPELAIDITNIRNGSGYGGETGHPRINSERSTAQRA